MRPYELVFIVHPDLDESALNDLIERVKGWITGAGGAISKVDIWGKRKLTYEIRKQKEGQYVLFHTDMPPQTSSVLERNLRFTEPVLRFLITTLD